MTTDPTDQELIATIRKVLIDPGHADEHIRALHALTRLADRLEARLPQPDLEGLIKELEAEGSAYRARLATWENRVERAEERARQSHQKMREYMEASWHLRYPVTPELLEAAAERIDCGGECESAWREWDTNATGCTQSETKEGCPFEMAAELRDFAKALRTQAALPAQELPAKTVLQICEECGITGEQAARLAGALCPDGETLLASLTTPLRPTQESREGWKPTHRHVKRGTDYQVIGTASLQAGEPIGEAAS
ncbi:MAG TPA: hypothetical protein VFB02_13705, partial [Bradyrhizobium sp.]|nr:hypothetical protein [Bradyrhizobium sp.]